MSVLHALDSVQTGIRLQHISHGVEHLLHRERRNVIVALDLMLGRISSTMRILACGCPAVCQRQVFLAVDKELGLHTRLRDELNREPIAIFKCIGHGVFRFSFVAVLKERIETIAARQRNGIGLFRRRIDLDLDRICVCGKGICSDLIAFRIRRGHSAQGLTIRQHGGRRIALHPDHIERNGAALIIGRIGMMNFFNTRLKHRRPRNGHRIAIPLGAEGDIARDRGGEHVCRVGQRSVGLHQIPAREGIAVARRLRGRFDRHSILLDDLRAGNRAGVRHADIKGHRVGRFLGHLRPIRIQFNIFGDRRCEVIRRQSHFAAVLGLHTPILKDISFRMLIGGAGVLGALAVRDVDGREEGFIGTIREIVVELDLMLARILLPHRRKNGIGRNFFHRVAGLEERSIACQLVAVLVRLFPLIAAPALEGAARKCRCHRRKRIALRQSVIPGGIFYFFRNTRRAGISAVVVGNRIACLQIRNTNLSYIHGTACLIISSGVLQTILIIPSSDELSTEYKLKFSIRIHISVCGALNISKIARCKHCTRIKYFDYLAFFIVNLMCHCRILLIRCLCSNINRRVFPIFEFR